MNCKQMLPFKAHISTIALYCYCVVKSVNQFGSEKGKKNKSNFSGQCQQKVLEYLKYCCHTANMDCSSKTQMK